MMRARESTTRQGPQKTFSFQKWLLQTSGLD